MALPRFSHATATVIETVTGGPIREGTFGPVAVPPPGTKLRTRMFLKSYVEIPNPFGAVRAAMEREPLSWLDGLAVEAEQEGETLLVDVGLSLAGRGLRRPADLEVGEPQLGDAVASLPIRLRVHGSRRLLPSFYGSLDAAWLGAKRTQLALSLQYEPPLGLLGKAIDRTLLHRVAESVAQNFLAGAARRVEERTHGAATGKEVGGLAPH